MTLLPVLNPLLALAFAVTAGVYFLEFLRGPGQRIPAARFFLAGALGLALVRFGIFLQVLGRPPLAGPGEAFTTIALSVAVVFALLEFLHGEHSTGFLLLLVAAAFQTIGVIAPPTGTEVNFLLKMPWFGVHVLTAILGYTAFAVGAVYATLFLLLYGDLKRHRFGFVYERVPSLDVLSGMTIRTAALGFGFLTLAIVVGAFGWVRELDHSMLEDPKVMSSLLVWVVYGVALGLHRYTGWRGIRSIGITLAAFVLMVLSSWLVPAFLASAHDVKELL